MNYSMSKKIVAILFRSICLGVICIHHSFAQSAGNPLPSWQEGYMDIHHINTGMGDCTFFIFPDGTTMLFDAGEMNLTNPRMMGPRNAKRKPNDSKTPGEWIVEYIRPLLQNLPDQAIDYALISHFHDDHMGSPHPLSPTSASGSYKLTGITTVGEYIPIKTLLDRAWPEYDYPAPLQGKMMDNYRAFQKWQIENKNMTVARFKAGVNNQITLKNKAFPSFECRNIGVNGEIWTGVANNTRAHFPTLESLKAQGLSLPGENPCSLSFRISYGAFDYFSGGDIPGVLAPGQASWNDIETPVAKAVGPVEVNVLNHHGNKDSQNPFFLESLRPRVHIMSVWSSDHPGHAVMSRLLNTHIYPGPRDIFATNMLEPNYQVIGSDLEKLKSDQGHIVIRVAPDGKTYRVIILDDSSTKKHVKEVFGPYTAR